jgi:hypothetical protein
MTQGHILTLINHKSSSRIPFQNTLLVVRRGNWSEHKETGRQCHKRSLWLHPYPH